MTTIGRPVQSASQPYAPAELRQLRLRDRKQNKLVLDPIEDRLWHYYDHVEGIGTYVSVLANAADLVTYYPAIENREPEGEPDPKVDAAVVEVWDDLGGEAWLSTWMSELTRHMLVPGQGWIVPVRPDSTEMVGEDSELDEVEWKIWSTLEVREALGISQSDQIPVDDQRIWRVWMPHPQNGKRADSAVRRVADKCEALVLIDRRRIADLRSRLHAGVWPLPASLKDEKTPSGKTYADLVEESMIDPIHNPDSTSSLFPLMLWVEEADEKLMRGGPIQLAIDDPARLDVMEEKLLRRVVIGIDAPPEIMLGMGDVNHWGQWLLEKQTYSQHLDPLLVRILRSLTPWWQSILEARGIASEGQMLWRNPATAIAQPNTYERDRDLWDRGILSDEVLLTSTDHTLEDRPDDDEITRRIEIVQGLRGRTSQETIDVDPEGTPDTTNPAEDDSGPDPVQAQTGEDSDAELAALALALARIDETLIVRMQTEAARQQTRAYRRALDRLVQAAERAGIEVGDKETLPARLGQARAVALVANLVPEDEFDGDRIAPIIESAQDQTSEAVARFGADRNRDADADDRNAAVSLILAALAAATFRGLFSRETPEGETGIDGAELLPFAEIRNALDIAGGGPASRDGVRDAWALIGNGRRSVLDLLDVGIETVGFTWDYGAAPRQNFPPHQALDGVTFDRWDDPRLRSYAPWSWVGEYFRISDHKGCRCIARRELASNALRVAV